MKGPPRTLFVSCGEPSGETYAVRAVRAFRARNPEAPVVGIGSSRLRDEGVGLLLDYGAISVVGLTEVIRHLPAVAGALRAARRAVVRPDVGAVLLVDFPDFNFRVGKRAAAAGVPVVYYIPPQLWAWRAGRAAQLARFTKGVVVPFPFEEPLLRAKGVDARFAGHPLLDELGPWLDAAPDPARFGFAPGTRVVGLLPGSRRGEIASHFPLMLEAARRIASRFPDVRFAVPLAAPGHREAIEGILRAGSDGGAAPPVTVVDSDRFLLYRTLFLALSASGTATLELALLGVPPVIVYRTSGLTYRIGKRLATVDCIGLPNIVAGGKFLPELIQDACRADRMADEIARLLGDESGRNALSARCLALRDRLRGPGPAEAVADMLAAASGGAWA